MSAKTKMIIDILERAFFTYAETFFGLLIAANVWTGTQAGGLLSVLQVVQVAAVSAIPAALAILKGGLATLIGDRNTAAALPKDLTKP